MDCVRRDEAAFESSGVEAYYWLELESQQRICSSLKDDVSSLNVGRCTFHLLVYGKESKCGM